MSTSFVAALKLVALIGLALVFSTTQSLGGGASAPSQTVEKKAAQAEEAKTFNQEQALAELRKKLAGQETKPAEEVFKNIQLLKGMPAGRLLRVMEMGYAKSLGVNCTHCHVIDQWEKDDKSTKQIAREMAEMARVINNDHLKKIKNLKSENPVINCTTCHRGQTKPALNLP